MKLEVGKPKEVDVIGSEPWNSTGLNVTIGESYAFEVIAQYDWRDASLLATADGLIKTPFYFRPGLIRSCLRCPKAEWYSLTGTIARTDEHAFPIGSKMIVEIEHSGELYLFANDVPRFYYNNHGTLKVVIRRDR